MRLLVSGVLLWSAVHLFPAVAPEVKKKLAEKIGTVAYRGIFSILIVISLVCIVFGWRNCTPAIIYDSPSGMHLLTAALMLIALVLFFSSRIPTDIKRVIRHPQLTGVLIWAVAHLLTNGDARSLVLFGGLGVWAIVEIVVLSRGRVWMKPAAVGGKRSLVPALVGAAAWIALALVHPWIAGVPALPFLS